MWNVIENNPGLCKRAVLPEKAALDLVIHKYALLCENTHKTAINLVLAPTAPGNSSKVQKGIFEVVPTGSSQSIINLHEGAMKPIPIEASSAAENPGVEAEETICINHIYYSLPSTDTTVATAKSNTAQTSNARRATDLLLLRIERKICLTIPLFAADPADAAAVLTTHLEMLSEYMLSSKNRILGQQVVDVAMEGMLQVKSKIIEIAYQIGKSLA